jgi:hypothetical protein
MNDIPISPSRAGDDAEKALIVAAIRKATADNGGLPLARIPVPPGDGLSRV